MTSSPKLRWRGGAFDDDGCEGGEDGPILGDLAHLWYHHHKQHHRHMTSRSLVMAEVGDVEGLKSLQEIQVPVGVSLGDVIDVGGVEGRDVVGGGSGLGHQLGFPMPPSVVLFERLEVHQLITTNATHKISRY